MALTTRLTLTLDPLPEAERLRLLAAFDQVVARIPAGDQDGIDLELRQARTARLRGGRASDKPK